MDARSPRSARGLLRLAVCVGIVALVRQSASAAQFASTNFVVNAPTPALAKEIAEAAEHWRRVLAIDWIGEEMPAWSKPCPIKAEVAPHLGAGGMTTFVFDRGQVFNWRMTVSGSRQRVLDSVLPHEITHTIFACHFRQPLPRWADEGACTTVEHQSEISKQENLLMRFLKSGKGIPFDKMFAMKEYPADVLPLYAQGHSLTCFLIGREGRTAFLEFLDDGMNDEDWPRAVREHYGYENLFALQNAWLDWVKQGRPSLEGESQPATLLADNAAAGPTKPPQSQRSVASQSYESAYSRAARAAREQADATDNPKAPRRSPVSAATRFDTAGSPLRR